MAKTSRFSPESIGVLAFLMAKHEQMETILAINTRYTFGLPLPLSYHSYAYLRQPYRYHSSACLPRITITICSCLPRVTITISLILTVTVCAEAYIAKRMTFCPIEPLES